MNIIDTLKLWDSTLFLFINGMHAPFFDGIMFAISYKFTWVPLYIAVLYMIIKHWKRESIWIILALIVCIVIADQVSSGLIKHLVERPRPSHAAHLNGLVHLVNGYSGGLYGFVSSHAANSFGFALLSSLIFRHKSYTILLFVWAVLTAYSRIYLGVHYPLDIVGGIMVGILAALLCFAIIKRFRPSLLEIQEKDSISNKPNTFIPLLILGLSFTGIIIYSIVIL
ncbi:MAG: phosphatase PAP2 family protein [Paludibacter sp.]